MFLVELMGYHSIHKKVSKIEIVHNTQILQSGVKIYFCIFVKVKLKLSKVSKLFKALLKVNIVIVQSQKHSPVVFFKNVVLKSFTIFTGKHLFWSPF